MLDCLVIGGGPAGLLAAVYLGRYRRNVQVIDDGQSRAAKIPESHNYPGFFGIGGTELLLRLREQAEQYGAQLSTGRVTSLRRESEKFVASCKGAEIKAKFVLLATGLVDHCPPDARKALEEDKLAVFDAPKKIMLDAAGQIAIETENGSVHDLDAIYPALGCTVRSELATSLGASCTDIGNLVVDDHQQTTVHGLYAAGDVVTDLHQLSGAFGHAAIAATDIHNRLPRNYR